MKTDGGIALPIGAGIVLYCLLCGYDTAQTRVAMRIHVDNQATAPTRRVAFEQLGAE